MKVIISGSRSILNYEILEEAIKESGFIITQVISGTARGVDELGERWAAKNNVSVREMSANWDFFGKSARYLRNEEMFKIAEGIIVLWDGKSKNSKNMISIAKRYNLKIFVKEIQYTNK